MRICLLFFTLLLEKHWLKASPVEGAAGALRVLRNAENSRTQERSLLIAIPPEGQTPMQSSITVDFYGATSYFDFGGRAIHGGGIGIYIAALEPPSVPETIPADTCTICMDNYDVNTNFYKLENCSHVYHQACIAQWAASHKTCPLCKGNLSLKDLEDLRGVIAGRLLIDITPQTRQAPGQPRIAFYGATSNFRFESWPEESGKIMLRIQAVRQLNDS